MNLVYFYNKSPLEKEPDKKIFYYKKYECLILRDLTFGYLKGYVKVSEDNHISSTDYLLIDCFEGINFLAKIPGHNGIFIGFSCHNHEILSPLNKKYYDYKTITYVEKELCNIVDQIIEKDLFKK